MDLTSTTKTAPLQFRLLVPDRVSDRESAQMFALMAKYYGKMNFQKFSADLKKKQFIGSIWDDDRLVGFSTIAINPQTTSSESHLILFSGDTIVEESAWGQQSLARGLVYTFGQLCASNSNKKTYWYLISKGYRTYMYLPLFGKRFYPTWDPDRRDPLFELADQCSREMFGSRWDPERGIIKADPESDFLKPEFSGKILRKNKNPHIRFFNEMNPGFNDGDELVCIVELSEQNLIGFAKKWFIDGFRTPI